MSKTSAPPREFIDPPWNAPLDVERVLAEIPDSATIAGMFTDAIVQQARERGGTLPSARERYTRFRFYPQHEHVQVLVEACEFFLPGDPLRTALRRIGRTAPSTLVSSTLGAVVLGSAEGVHEVLKAMVKTYPINMRPSLVEILEMTDRSAMIHLKDFFFFLDSHHIAVFEGALHYAGVKGKVQICAYSDTEADILCTWGGDEET